MVKVSVITICYNAEGVEDTCKSIASQSFDDFEWIVIDGGSKSEILDIFSQYKNKMTYFVSEPDDGIYNAMNKGISQAKGEYLIFMNAGDSFYKETLLEEIFTQSHKADVIYGDIEFDYIKWKKVFHSRKVHNKYFFINDTLCHQATFIKKDVFNKLGLYDESFRIVADFEKFTNLAVNGGTFEYVPYIIASFRAGGISSDSSRNRPEIDRVHQKYYTNAEITKYKHNHRSKIFQKIFSIKNSTDKKFKIISILGFKIYIKRKK